MPIQTDGYFEGLFQAILFVPRRVKTILKRVFFPTCRNPETVLGVKKVEPPNDCLNDVDT